MPGLPEMMLINAQERLAAMGRKPKAVQYIRLPSRVESDHTAFMLNIAKGFKNNYNNYKNDILNIYSGFRTDSQTELNNILRQLDEDNTLSIEAALAGVLVAANQTNAFALQAWRETTEKALSFDLSPFMGYPDQEINAMVDWNTRLIKDMSRSQRRLIRDEIKKAVEQQWTRKRLSDRLEDVLGRQQRNRARLIASDQIGKLYGSIIRRYSIEAGITQYRWQTRLDERVRESHDAMHARIGRWDRRDLVAGLDKKGEKVVWRKRGGNLPQSHPMEEINCRCVGLPVFTSNKQSQAPSAIQELQQQFETTT